MYAALALGLYTSQGERCAQNCDFYGRKKIIEVKEKSLDVEE